MFLLITMLVSAGVWPMLALADAPLLIPVQGYLTDDAGAPLDGITSSPFPSMDVPAGGLALFQEVRDSTVENGLFTEYLETRSPSPSPTNSFATTTSFTSASRSGRSGGHPRLQLATSPYAMFASTVRTP